MTEIGNISAMDIGKLLKNVPHRYPFLLIDRVEEIKGLESGIGIKNVTFNEPHFQGHFPAAPIMPGVLIIEAMAQTVAAILLNHYEMQEDSLTFFVSIDKAKFRNPVVPGDILELHMQYVKERLGIYVYSGKAIVSGKKVAEAIIAAKQQGFDQ